MQLPEGITNEPLFVKRCCQIVARARDFMEGRMDLFMAAKAIKLLGTWTRRLELDDNLRTFATIYDELSHLPAGPERAQWAKAALIKEDEKIRQITERWRAPALVAAQNLVGTYSWAYGRRAEIRQSGDSSAS